MFDFANFNIQLDSGIIVHMAFAGEKQSQAKKQGRILRRTSSGPQQSI